MFSTYSLLFFFISCNVDHPNTSSICKFRIHCGQWVEKLPHSAYRDVVVPLGGRRRINIKVAINLCTKEPTFLFLNARAGKNLSSGIT